VNDADIDPRTITELYDRAAPPVTLHEIEHRRLGAIPSAPRRHRGLLAASIAVVALIGAAVLVPLVNSGGDQPTPAAPTATSPAPSTTTQEPTPVTAPDDGSQAPLDDGAVAVITVDGQQVQVPAPRLGLRGSIRQDESIAATAGERMQVVQFAEPGPIEGTHTVVVTVAALPAGFVDKTTGETDPAKRLAAMVSPDKQPVQDRIGELTAIRVERESVIFGEPLGLPDRISNAFYIELSGGTQLQIRSDFLDLDDLRTFATTIAERANRS
jgi:hypothetical protein